MWRLIFDYLALKLGSVIRNYIQNTTLSPQGALVSILYKYYQKSKCHYNTIKMLKSIGNMPGPEPTKKMFML